MGFPVYENETLTINQDKADDLKSLRACAFLLVYLLVESAFSLVISHPLYVSHSQVQSFGINLEGA